MQVASGAALLTCGQKSAQLLRQVADICERGDVLRACASGFNNRWFSNRCFLFPLQLCAWIQCSMNWQAAGV